MAEGNNNTSNKIIVSKNDICDDEVNESLENEFRTSLIDNLDDDCLLHIFSYLSLHDIISTQKVCERWKQLCQQRWKIVKSFYCKRDHWCLETEPLGRIMFEGKNIKVLKELLQHCGQFIKYYHLFDYDNSEEINLFLFVTVAELCLNVVNADIECFGNQSQPFMEIRSMAINWKNLEELSIFIDDAKLEEDLCKLLKNNKKIKYISVGINRKNDDFVPGKFLKYLSEDTIEFINIKIYCSMTISMSPTKFLSAMLKKFTNLKSFRYRFSEFIDDATAKAIGELKTLIYLHLEGARFESPSSINYIANLVNLKELSLRGIPSFQDDVLINISSNCSQLEYLDISFCQNITDRGIASIAQLTRLKYLDITEVQRVTNENIENLPDSLESLMYDSLSNVPNFADSSVIRLIRKATNLQYLSLLCGSTITPVIIKAAVEITNERQNGFLLIDVTESRISDSQLPRTPFLSYHIVGTKPHRNMTYIHSMSRLTNF